MLACFLVGAGGFIGAVFRYLFTLLPLSDRGAFPFVTLAINVLGALLIGFLTGLAAARPNAGRELMLFLRVGVCGGFTTFSTFALETARLFDAGRIGAGVGYIVLSVLLSVLAVIAGRALAA